MIMPEFFICKGIPFLKGNATLKIYCIAQLKNMTSGENYEKSVK